MLLVLWAYAVQGHARCDAGRFIKIRGQKQHAVRTASGPRAAYCLRIQRRCRSALSGCNRRFLRAHILGWRVAMRVKRFHDMQNAAAASTAHATGPWQDCVCFTGMGCSSGAARRLVTCRDALSLSALGTLYRGDRVILHHLLGFLCFQAGTRCVPSGPSGRHHFKRRNSNTSVISRHRPPRSPSLSATSSFWPFLTAS